MRTKRDESATAWQGEMRAVEKTKPHGVELIVVFSAEPFEAFIVLPNPRFEPLFDLLQLVARSLGFCGIYATLFGSRIGVVNRRRLQIERILNQLQCGVSVCAPFCGIRDRDPRRKVPTQKPSPDNRRMRNRHAFASE